MREMYEPVLPAAAEAPQGAHAIARAELEEFDARIRKTATAGAEALLRLQFDDG